MSKIHIALHEYPEGGAEIMAAYRSKEELLAYLVADGFVVSAYDDKYFHKPTGSKAGGFFTAHIEEVELK